MDACVAGLGPPSVQPGQGQRCWKGCLGGCHAPSLTESIDGGLPEVRLRSEHPWAGMRCHEDIDVCQGADEWFCGLSLGTEQHAASKPWNVLDHSLEVGTRSDDVPARCGSDLRVVACAEIPGNDVPHEDIWAFNPGKPDDVEEVRCRPIGVVHRNEPGGNRAGARRLEEEQDLRGRTAVAGIEGRYVSWVGHRLANLGCDGLKRGDMAFVRPSPACAAVRLGSQRSGLSAWASGRNVGRSGSARACRLGLTGRALRDDHLLVRVRPTFEVEDRPKFGDQVSRVGVGVGDLDEPDFEVPLHPPGEPVLANRIEPVVRRIRRGCAGPTGPSVEIEIVLEERPDGPPHRGESRPVV